MEKLSTGKYRIISFTDTGKELMRRLGDMLSESEKTGKVVISDVSTLEEFTGTEFKKGNVLIYIGAVAIAVRAIARYIQDKTTDPAVIAIDEGGNFVIPVLSGHLGGANEYAGKIADLLGAIPVITTATDIRGEFAVDVFAARHDMEINDMNLAKEFSAQLLRGEDAVFTVSPKVHSGSGLYLIPKCLVVGMGCKKGKSASELESFLFDILAENSLDRRAIKAIVSIDRKEKEEGLIELSDSLKVPFITYSPEILMKQEGDFASSEFVLETTGCDNICERAVAAYGAEKIAVYKTARCGMTVAIGIFTGKENNEE